MKVPILIIKRTFIRSDCLESLAAFSGLTEPKKEQLYKYSRPTTKGYGISLSVSVSAEISFSAAGRIHRLSML